ncbi:MAG: hypothetical protein ACM3SY_10620 [Candidatus Omnitrophota bacterium]
MKPNHINKRKRIVAASLVAASIIVCVTVFFYKPIFAFNSTLHPGITRDGLADANLDALSLFTIGFANGWVDWSEGGNPPIHGDNNLLDQASGILRSRLEKILTALQNCNRTEALYQLGAALHTVQDVWAHTNAVNNHILIADILHMSRGTAACDKTKGFAPGGLVSGYYSSLGALLLNECLKMPPRMCCHRDLNKDNPQRPLYSLARQAAVSETRKYFSIVENYLFEGCSSKAMADRFMKLLKTQQRKLVFALDDTESMTNDLETVKRAVNESLDLMAAHNEIPGLGLVTFKDEVTDQGLSCGIDNFRLKINALEASGGGDCPEASNQALLTALKLFSGDLFLGLGDWGNRILLATDASERSPFLGPLVKRTALEFGVKIDAILTGDCTTEANGVLQSGVGGQNKTNLYASDLPESSSNDPLTSPLARVQLNALTEETGGVLLVADRNEIDRMTRTVLEMGEPGNTVIFQRKVRCTTGVPLEWEIPVDETIDQTVTFMVSQPPSGKLAAFEVITPDGEAASTLNREVKSLQLKSLRSLSIPNPVPRKWKVKLDGQGTAVVRAYAHSALRILHISLLTANVSANPRVEAVPIPGDPVIGSAILADIHLSEAPGEVTVMLKRPNGQLIREFTPQPGDDEGHFRVSLTVPNDVFLFEIVGKTKTGSDFCRTMPIPITPQPVSVTVDPRYVRVPIHSYDSEGSDIPVTVTVTNASNERATYALTATVPRNWPQVSLPPVELKGKETREISVILRVPKGEPNDAGNAIVFMAQNVTKPAVRNSAVLRIRTVLNESGEGRSRNAKRKSGVDDF